MAKYTQDNGAEIEDAKWPFELLFVPNSSLKASNTGASYMEPKWQDQVTTLKTGDKIFDVYAYAEPDTTDADRQLIAEIYADTDF